MKVKVNPQIKQRIANLPQIFTTMLRAVHKVDAVGVIKEYKDGLRGDTLGLERLKPRTIAKKEKAGFPYPTHPLVGLNGREKRSLINALYVQDDGKYMRIKPSERMHWKAKLTLSHLFNIHSFGVKFRGRGKGIIKIPPRPALLKAYDKWMLKKQQRSKTPEIQAAIVKYINKGETIYRDRILRQAESDERRIMEA